MTQKTKQGPGVPAALGLTFLAIGLLNLLAPAGHSTDRWRWILVAVWFIIAALHLAKALTIVIRARRRRE
jgi:hypothetical protein